MSTETALRENLNDEQYLASIDIPESIVVWTFTEKAAESIKRRVAESLEKSDLSVAMIVVMYICTIHSYYKAPLLGTDSRSSPYTTNFDALNASKYSVPQRCHRIIRCSPDDR